jgi:hypothetical protein
VSSPPPRQSRRYEPTGRAASSRSEPGGRSTACRRSVRRTKLC